MKKDLYSKQQVAIRHKQEFDFVVLPEQPHDRRIWRLRINPDTRVLEVQFTVGTTDGFANQSTNWDVIRTQEGLWSTVLSRFKDLEIDKILDIYTRLEEELERHCISLPHEAPRQERQVLLN